jgi:hypothetical protein
MRFASCGIVLVACAAQDQTKDVVLHFTPDPGPVGSEQYQCFGFDMTPLGDSDVGGIRHVQIESPVLVHHATLYASRSPFPDGPVDCIQMPDDAVPLNVWAPGGGDLALASDVSLVIPDGTQRLVVQTHALRTDGGPAPPREIVLEPRRAARNRAGWLPLRAPVPVLHPGERRTAAAACEVSEPVHVLSTWPHMHRIGAEFHGAILRQDDVVEPLVDVVPWDFELQRAYVVDADLATGDAITTQCSWFNTTSQVVLPGPRITDEMCGQSLIVYPHRAARCR